MESTGEKIGTGVAIVVAVLFVYATFPAMQSLVMPSAPLLWEPILSVSQTLSVFSVIIAIGVTLAVVNRLRYARATGNPVIPALVWVVFFAIVAATVTALVSVIAFEVTFQSMLSVGVNSSVALMVGAIVGFGVWLLLSRK